ncbi:MAG: OmpA family protein, partial [Flavobacteriaceae bacterium]
ARNRISQLEKELAEARNRKPQKETVVETKRTLESVVTFRQGRSNIEVSQLPNVERIATYLRKYPNSKVVIKGFASPEGSIEVNERIAKARAEAVKAVLIKQYKIDAERIVAEGNGIGDMFSEPDWNRVSIATIKE